MEKKHKVAVLLNKAMAKSILSDEDIAFLQGFADTNPLDELPEEMTEDFMKQAIAGADACLTCWGTPGITEDVLAAADALKLVSHAAGSIKHMIPANFWDGKRRITSNAPVIAEDVAQTTLAFILTSLGNLWGFARSTREGRWNGGEAGLFKTKKLNGLQVGVVGASKVGQEVIKALKPFDCIINLYDPMVSPMEAEMLGVKLFPNLDDMLPLCDVITLHAPPVESCRHLINKNNAPLIKDGALFVNTARGMLVDEAALIKELETGRIFACIDVTDPEPPVEDHPFRKLENVVLTPHIAGGHTENGRKRLGRCAIMEIYNYLSRGILLREVRQEMLKGMA